MKKLFLFTAATMVLSSSFSVQAKAISNVSDCSQSRKCLVSFSNQNCTDNLHELFNSMGMDFKNGIWNGCPVIIISGINKPGANTPEINVPEINTPEVNVPETNVPEINSPEFEEVVTSQPATSEPVTSRPVINEPATDKPVIEETSTTESVTSKPNNETSTQSPVIPEYNSKLTFAEQVVKLVNEERVKAGLKEVVLDKQIESAALIRAKEIEKSFSHTRPDGSNFSTVLKEQGISYRGAGENIAWGQVSPEQVMNAWMNSAGHRANILNERYTKIGVGYYQNSNGRNYWAQLFTY